MMTKDKSCRPSDPQGDAAEAMLEERGYSFDEHSSEGLYFQYEKDSTNASLSYDDAENLKELSVNIPEGEPSGSNTELDDLNPEAVYSAINHLKSEEVSCDVYSNEYSSGLLMAGFEPQESPKETVDLLEDTVEAVETVAEIRRTLG